MAINMSYCAFENTYIALQECLVMLYEKEPEELSEREKKYYNNLIKLCAKFERTNELLDE